MPEYTSDVILGERYRDTQTGTEGVATSVHFYQYACERITLEVVKNDRSLEDYSFDAPRLEAVSTGTPLTATKTGGPVRVEGNRKDPVR